MFSQAIVHWTSEVQNFCLTLLKTLLRTLIVSSYNMTAMHRLYCLIQDLEALVEAMLKQCPVPPCDSFQWLHVPVSLLNHLPFLHLETYNAGTFGQLKFILLSYLHQQYFSE